MTALMSLGLTFASTRTIGTDLPDPTNEGGRGRMRNSVPRPVHAAVEASRTGRLDVPAPGSVGVQGMFDDDLDGTCRREPLQNLWIAPIEQVAQRWMLRRFVAAVSVEDGQPVSDRWYIDSVSLAASGSPRRATVPLPAGGRRSGAAASVNERGQPSSTRPTMPRMTTRRRVRALSM